ncbi:MAG: hypothetical protein NWE88_05545 [Candidatus Bathyarchaeota archaeon]|nr:hypothetical protein [Candidatus Bathyarchaeota archaeon]
MPVLKLHLESELIDRENFDDLLTFANEAIQDKTKQFKNRAQYLRQILRDYTTATNAGFRRWEVNGVINIRGRSEKHPDLKLWSGPNISELEGGEGVLFTLNIGKLQVKYLERALIWENTFQSRILGSNIIHKNVAELAHFVLTNAILDLQRRVLDEQLRLEEEELLAEHPDEEDEVAPSEGDSA